MKAQNRTGTLTEGAVRKELLKLGLIVAKPIPDQGIDLIVLAAERRNREVRVQIKGRGSEQANRRYRWFQIRTTKSQRESAIQSGLPVSESWRKKVDLCDFFIFVSLKLKQHWVFPVRIVREIVEINRTVYGNREDNRKGHQAEVDLDIEYKGKRLSERYATYLNNYALIANKLMH